MLIRFLMIILLAPAFLKGLIVESSKFAEIEKHIDKHEKMVIVCDIDNTLLRAKEYLGSVAWSDHHIAELVSKGVSREEAEIIENILWKTVQPHIKVVSIDDQAPAILKEIQNKGCLIFGLTARAPEEVDYTVDQLFSIGIDFGNPKHSFVFEDKNALYKEGIIFASPFNKKSHTLFKFLDENKIDPEFIVFIDDKLNHVEDLSCACEKTCSFLT